MPLICQDLSASPQRISLRSRLRVMSETQRTDSFRGEMMAAAEVAAVVAVGRPAKPIPLLSACVAGMY